jgi:FtsP/CotA-like multicopper oxidase with cupredoxin domain
MLRIGGDAGLVDEPLALDQLVLHPSERAELLVTLEETTESEIVVPFQDVDRFDTGLPEPDVPLFHLEVGEPWEGELSALPSPLSVFEPLDTEGLPTREIALGETATGEMTVNGVVFPGFEDTPHVGFVGESEIWEVRNDTDFAHPFHLHGFSFQVLDVGQQPWPVREWKDTANIPPRQTLRFYVNYDNRPGLWMFHCHILGHAKLGMMSMLDIRAP